MKLLVLALVVGATACASSVRPVACSVPRVLARETYAVSADLDCDGREDWLEVSWQEVSEGQRVVLFRREGESVTQVVLSIEPLPEIAGLADLDEDGVNEVLLVTRDPGVLFPTLVRFEGSEGSAVEFESREEAWKANLVFDVESWRRCETEGWPRFEMERASVVLLLPYENPLETTCERVVMRPFVLSRGLLVLR